MTLLYQQVVGTDHKTDLQVNGISTTTAYQVAVIIEKDTNQITGKSALVLFLLHNNIVKIFNIDLPLKSIRFIPKTSSLFLLSFIAIMALYILATDVKIDEKSLKFYYFTACGIIDNSI